MTKLIVTPLDMAAPGSYKARRLLQRLTAIYRTLRDMGDADDEDSRQRRGDLMGQAWALQDDLLLPRLRTDDGTPVEDALDTLSAADFDSMLSRLAAASDGVPPTSASNLSSPSEESESLPNG